MTALNPPAGASSPFKFLDAYGAQDASVFFGRDEEIDELYRLLGESRLVLVYGQPGTGKTSLVQSGLAKKFSPTNWLPLTVRRGNNIAATLDQVLSPAAPPAVQSGNFIGAALGEVLSTAAITPLEPESSIVDEIRSVFLDHLRPVFLIIDQFEKLYVFGTKAEQDAFYATIKAVLDADVSCRIIILLREEFLAALDPFERAVPALFDKRLRVEVMTNSNVEMVILRTCAAHGIGLEHGADTARLIIDQLDDARSGVQLAYLQVYLDHLYRVAARQGGAVMITDAAIGKTGKLGDVMAGFLDEQEKVIEAALGTVPQGGIARLLEEFVAADGSKQPSTYDQVLSRTPAAAPWLRDAIDLLQASRLLRTVEGHYELAHDAFVARIAERRSGEIKQLLMVEKMVQNHAAEFAHTKTLLNAGELALVKSAGKLVDPLDGSRLLKLDEGARKFVRTSRRNMWQRRIAIGAAVLGGITAVVAMIVTNVVQSQAAEQRIRDQAQAAEIGKANMNNVADVLAFGTYQALHNSTKDLAAAALAVWTHDVIRNDNITRDQGKLMDAKDYKDADADNSFWGRLYYADTLIDSDPAKGIAIYRQLEDQQWRKLLANPADVSTIGKYKAVMWHHIFMLPENDEQLGNRLFDFMLEHSKIDGDPLRFADDLSDLCYQPRVRRMLPQKCESYPAAPAEQDLTASDTPPPLKY